MTDFSDIDLIEDLPTLKMVPSFIEVIRHIPWFRTVGEQPSEAICTAADDYAASLGFPEAYAHFVPDWEEAAYALEANNYNSPGWEAEEQERASLTDRVLSVLDDQTFEMVFSHIASETIPVVEEYAEEVRDELLIMDEEFVVAVTGLAAQAIHQAALVMLTAEDEEHPLSKRIKLFELGRIPIGIQGTSFAIY
ncbi:hypothetical protein QGN29_03610 [Temperatibacter marinus]|uniref:Uncharacterized protein n=1 Tax=Temperatibacter marinus TaxID=1456591 RepID=A0AA52HAB8_9PROT|nr:hypothetical protein [Temperatibacter marinus]WND03457.1 hypothetical protein QGN29_03610 [Temperatibacter marinus]